MTGKSEPGSETRNRTNRPTSGPPFSRRTGRWWLAPLALILAAAVLAVGAVVLTQPSPRAAEEWSAISLNFGSNPLTNTLNVSFSRVAYLSQPTEWNSTGFINGTLTQTQGSAWFDNSTDYGTHYGIGQFNASDKAEYATTDFHVGGSLGANVSYIFVDQRFAVNGTGAIFGAGVSEARLAGSSFPSSGNVTNAAAGTAQNAIWLTASNATGDVYSITAYDWEEKPGGFQTVTSYTLSPTITLQPLEFYELYVYAQPLQTVVSVVNTTDGTVLASTAAMHPVLDQNLTDTAYLSDEIYSGGTTDAMILDSAWLVDHNAYTNEPGAAITERSPAPMVAGDFALSNVDPFDPSSVSASQMIAPSGTSSYSNTGVKLQDFPSIENSSTQDLMTSALINASDLIPVNGIGSGIKGFNATVPSTVDPAHALTTLRAEPEDTGTQTSADLYTTSWTGAQIGNGIHDFLTSYISARTGVPASDIQVPSFFVNDISVDTQFSDQAAQQVHDYLATTIPGYLSDSNLALVNTTTGAVEAGADIGSFMDLSTGIVYPAQVKTNDLGFSQVYDPVTHQWYASARAAGFPVGSSITTAGAIYVPDQAPFLGWSASGVPEFGPTAGCFIVCVSNPLSGAASAVSNFFGGAASTVSNAISPVSNAISGAVIKPVTGTVSAAVSHFTSDVSHAVAQVMPAIGGTLENIAGDVSGTVTHTLSGVGQGIASATSQTAGALLSGVKSIQTTMYHVGAAAGSAVTTAASDVAQGMSVIGNTVGKTLSTAAGVVSNTFASVGNAVATAGKEALGAVGGALSAVGNTLKSIGSTLLNAVELPFKALGSLFSFPTALASGVSALLEYVVVGVVVAVVIFLVVWLVVLRRRRSSKGKEIGASHERGHRHVRRSHRAAVRVAAGVPEWDAVEFLIETERRRWAVA